MVLNVRILYLLGMMLKKHIDKFGKDNATEMNIPYGVVEIEQFAFSDQSNIQSIIIPTTVTSIGDFCFRNCPLLTSISIPSTVQTIGKNCFIECNKLNKLTLPLNENNKYPFKVSYTDYLILKRCGIDCEKVVFTNNCYNKCNKTIPTDIPFTMFFNKTFGETDKTRIEDNIISIKGNHLSIDINSITIPSNVTYLCDYCFTYYSDLESITLPTTVKYIGKHLIDGCSSLTELKYEGDWNNIIVSYDDHLKFKSKGLIFNNIEYSSDDKKKYGNVIPSIVHSLHHSYYNRSNDMFHIPTHITSLDNHMFDSVEEFGIIEDYSKIQNIVIPTSIQTIPKYCFEKCLLLTSIELPSTLTTIKKKAFSKCISLQSIIIPSSVTLIEQYAFNGCYSLSRVILPTTITTFRKKCFNGCDQLKGILNIPNYCF
ncbi:hypothetical protein QTN25_004928 [Entamoeba marina]